MRQPQKAKDEGWDKGKFQHLREREVQAKQDLATIKRNFSTLNRTTQNDDSANIILGKIG